MAISERKEILLFSHPSDDGHRLAYLQFVSSLFPCRRGNVAEIFFSRSTAFFLMIEDSFAVFCAAAFLRALFGRRTVGLLLRPKPALEKTALRNRTKRFVLKIMKRIPAIKILTILPFSINSDFASIADDWIYDFQLWDLTEAQRVKAQPHQGQNPIAGIAPSETSKLLTLCALGRQDKRKGFDLFAHAAGLTSHFRFVAAGRVADEVQDAAEKLIASNGVLYNRYISDDELLTFYGQSNLVWALYAPYDDQASGILGRAVQLGIPVVVRSGSLSHKLCVSENLFYIDATENTLDRIASFRQERDGAAGLEAAEKFRAASLGRLRKALLLPNPIGAAI